MTIEEAIEKYPNYSFRVHIGNMDVHIDKEHSLSEMNWCNASNSITVKVNHGCNFLYVSTKSLTSAS